MTVEVSDAKGTATCATSVTLNPYSAPTVGFTPPDRSFECPAQAEFGTPIFNSNCDATLTVTSKDEPLPVSGRELSKTVRTWTAEDDLGQKISTSQTIAIEDNAGPVVAGVPATIHQTATTPSGAIVTFAAPLANDACDGPLSVVCSPASGSLFPVGLTTVTCTTTDGLGLQTVVIFDVNVAAPAPLAWSGLLQPITPDGTSVFKAGSTVPVKFTISGTSSGISAFLSYSRISGSLPGPVNEADAPGKRSDGNQFKYDSITGQYSFNWSTKGLSGGIYELIIDLGDASPKRVRLGLR